MVAFNNVQAAGGTKPSLLRPPSADSLADNEYRCPHCKQTQSGHRWISLMGACMHCGNCWNDAFGRGDDGKLHQYTDPVLKDFFDTVEPPSGQPAPAAAAITTPRMTSVPTTCCT